MILSSTKFGAISDPPRFSEDLDSGCSTPYVSAPSSPGRGSGGAPPPCGYFFSAPASPMHYISSKEPKGYSSNEYDINFLESPGSFEFEFSSRFSPNSSTTNGLMSSADELFLNGQIRPMKLKSHLLRPQNLDPLINEGVEEGDGVRRGRDVRTRNKSVHRKARSMSPMRNGQNYKWVGEKVNEIECDEDEDCLEIELNNVKITNDNETTPSCSASSSRSSSSGSRNSRKWIFLKDLLHRSKSEGRANGKERFWSTISFSPKDKTSTSPVLTPSSSRDDNKEKCKGNSQQRSAKKSTGKPANGVSKRRVAKSAHELHYTANRAQAEELKRKTFLPYRQGLLGCLGFSSKGYGALNGLTKSLNPISSR
ncbi:hypothetical protein Leryth_011200 [Lithospermum erythrorhizon]|uniref:Uncharacterized protein n=1 Tax=Lithospermum erythrorhizon TaxID=34254 RepID=A0AAV3Q9P4_LITER|nr:hypothetical protein Leryth_011200 [Lithospermum erythrorhizon]